MKSAAALLILLVVLMLAGCRPQPASESHSVTSIVTANMVSEPLEHSTGVLTGSVTKGPLAPVQQPGAPSESGVSGARLDISTLDGKPQISVETDSAGTFRVNLPAGTYKVTMPSLYGAMYSKDLPATVNLGAGEEKRLDIRLDTGIR